MTKSQPTTTIATIACDPIAGMWHEVSVTITDQDGQPLERVSSGQARATAVIYGQPTPFEAPLLLAKGERLWAAFTGPLEQVRVDFSSLPAGAFGVLNLQSWSACDRNDASHIETEVHYASS